MAFVFLMAACNNNKPGKNQNITNREKDDYSKNDNRATDDNSSTKEDLNQKSSWSDSDIKSFNEKCLETVKNKEELAKTFCPCLLEKFQSKYSSLAEMDNNATEQEGKKAAEECMALIKGKDDNNDMAGGWPDVERDDFVKNCVKNAMAGGRSRSVAQSYCDCMLNKMESLYPDIQDAGKLTDEDLKTPAMKKMIKDCLNDN